MSPDDTEHFHPYPLTLAKRWLGYFQFCRQLRHRLIHRGSNLLLLCSVLCFSSAISAQDNTNDTEDSEPEGRSALPNENQRMQLIAAALPKEHQQWLGEPDPFLALYRPALTSTANAIIIAANSADQITQLSEPGNSTLLSHLYYQLPDHGWSTLGLLPAPVPAKNIPARASLSNTTSNTSPNENEEATSAAADTSSESANNENASTANQTVDPRSEILGTRLAAVKNFLSQQGQTNTVLLVDNKQARLLLNAVEKNQLSPSAVFLLDNYSSRTTQIDLPELDTLKKLSALSLQIIDVVSHEMPDTIKSYRRRLFLQAEFGSRYRQLVFPDTTSLAGQQHALKRIRTWLEKN